MGSIYERDGIIAVIDALNVDVAGRTDIVVGLFVNGAIVKLGRKTEPTQPKVMHRRSLLWS